MCARVTSLHLAGGTEFCVQIWNVTLLGLQPKLLLSIGALCLAARALPAQNGWLFRTKDFPAATRELPSEIGEENLELLSELWLRARREGPLLSGRLVQAWKRGQSRGFLYRLTMLAALGLSGGQEAQAFLTERLERRNGARGSESFVVSALAAGHARARIRVELILRNGFRRKREPVERLAAAMAGLAEGGSFDPKDAGIKDPELMLLLRGLWASCKEQVGRMDPFEPAEAPKKAPADGSHVWCLVRTELLAF